MKILVPIKRVPDPYRKVRVTPDGDLDTAGIPWVIDPYDEAALSHALDLRAASSGEVIAVAVGEGVEQQMQAALALGADHAVHFQNASQANLPRFAQLLAELFEREHADLCVTGKLTSDTDDPQLGPCLAGMLDVPQATSALSVTLNGPLLRVVRTIDNGQETLDLTLPAVVTVDLRQKPLALTLPAIIAARKKPVEKIDANTLYVATPTWTKTLRYDAVPPRKPGRKIADVGELITALRDEARVI